MFLDVLNSTETGSGIVKQTADFYFERNPQVAAVLVTDARMNKRIYRKLVSTNFFLSHELDYSAIDEFIENEMDTAIQAKKGIEQVINASPFFGESILVLF